MPKVIVMTDDQLSIDVLESVRIPELKARINKIIAEKLGVRLGFEL